MHVGDRFICVCMFNNNNNDNKDNDNDNDNNNIYSNHLHITKANMKLTKIRLTGTVILYKQNNATKCQGKSFWIIEWA